MTKIKNEKQSCCGGHNKSATEQLVAATEMAPTCCQGKHDQNSKETETVITGCCGNKKH